MTSVFFEIKQLFFKEKFYRILLVVVILFYGGAFFLHKTMLESQQTIFERNVEQVKEILREVPQKAEVIEERLINRPWLLRSVQIFLFCFVVATGLGIWFDVSGLKRLFARKALIPSIRNKPHIAWGISEVIRVVILFFCLAILLNLGLSAYIAFLQFAFNIDVDRSLLMLMHTFFLDIGMALLIVFWVQKSGATVKDLFGFKFSEFPIQETWWGIRTYMMILPLLIGFLLLLLYLVSLIQYEPPAHPLVNVLLKDEKLSFSILFTSLFLACVVGPIMEEIFFRGFLYPALRRYWGVGRAMAVSSALFALVHENIFAFVPIFLLGIVLAYLYERRANLLSCITLHVTHNTVFLTYFFLMKNILIGGGE